MSPTPTRTVLRAVRLPMLLLLTVAGGSCGTGWGVAQREVVIVGGALKPNAQAYALIPTSDVVVPERGAGGLPDLVDLRRDGIVPPVQNQRWNSCVGWALAYYTMFGVHARYYLSRGERIDPNDPENWFSPDYLYSQRDKLEKRLEFDYLADEPVCFEPDEEIGCMRPERALQLLIEHGLARWQWMCDEEGSSTLRPCGPVNAYDLAATSRGMWQLAETNAGWYRPRCYVRFGALDSLQLRTIESIQSWLSEQGTPIAVVVRMTSGWVTFDARTKERRLVTSDGGCTEEEVRGVCVDAGGLELGSRHMMTIVGYDRDFPSRGLYPIDEDQQGSFLVVNQWGEKWGDRGYMWIPYAEMQRIWVAGYGLIRGDGTNNEEHPVCAQTDTGAWVNILEADDVALNLMPNKKDELVQVTTARPVPAEGVSCEGEFEIRDVVGGKGLQTELRDTADWYVLDVPGGSFDVTATLTALQPTEGDPDHEEPFEVIVAVTRPNPQTGAVETVEELQLAEGHRILDLRITNDALENIGVPTGPGVERARVCHAGEYFVRVAPNVFDRFENLRQTQKDQGIQYKLVIHCVAVAVDPCVETTGLEDPGAQQAPTPVVLYQDAPFAGTLAAASATDGSERKMYSVRAAVGRTVRITVSGLAAGARVQVVAAHYDQPVPVIRAMRSGVAVGGTPFEMNVPMDVQFSGVAIGLRNLDADDPTPYQLVVATVGLPGQNLPIEAVDDLMPNEVAQIASDVFRFEQTGEWFALRPWWEWTWGGNRRALLRASSCGADVTLRLRREDGTPLDDDPEVEVEESTAHGVRTWRITLPETLTDTVWVSFLDGDRNPATSYAVGKSRLVLLRNGFEGSPRDENGAPGKAVPLQVDAPPLEMAMVGDLPTLENPGARDSHDWFRVEVDADTTRVSLSFTDIVRTDGQLVDVSQFILSYWDECGNRSVWWPETPSSSAQVTQDLGGSGAEVSCEQGGATGWAGRVAGRTLYFMIENFSGLPITYKVQVVSR